MRRYLGERMLVNSVWVGDKQFFLSIGAMNVLKKRIKPKELGKLLEDFVAQGKVKLNPSLPIPMDVVQKVLTHERNRRLKDPAGPLQRNDFVDLHMFLDTNPNTGSDEYVAYVNGTAFLLHRRNKRLPSVMKGYHRYSVSGVHWVRGRRVVYVKYFGAVKPIGS